MNKIHRIDARNLSRYLKKKYDVIIIDPPWEYKSRTKKDKSAANYPMMDFDELMKMFKQLDYISAENSHLYLFSPPGFNLFFANKLIRTTSFKHKTTLVWDKRPRMGMGYYFRNCVEMILFGVKGKKKLTAQNFRSIISVKPEAGSVKPKELLDYFYKASGEGRYIYIFSGLIGHDKMLNIDLLI